MREWAGTHKPVLPTECGLKRPMYVPKTGAMTFDGALFCDYRTGALSEYHAR